MFDGRPIGHALAGVGLLTLLAGLALAIAAVKAC